jgi:hypothetical protein
LPPIDSRHWQVADPFALQQVANRNLAINFARDASAWCD